VLVSSISKKAVIVLKTPAERLRQQFRCLIASHESAADEPILETILIADGMYFGRKFHAAGYVLTFFAQEEQIKISAPNMQVIYTSSLEQFLANCWDDTGATSQAA
jgi:hypothetical protein